MVLEGTDPGGAKQRLDCRTNDPTVQSNNGLTVELIDCRTNDPTVRPNGRMGGACVPIVQTKWYELSSLVVLPW